MPVGEGGEVPMWGSGFGIGRILEDRGDFFRALGVRLRLRMWMWIGMRKDGGERYIVLMTQWEACGI